MLSDLKFDIHVMGMEGRYLVTRDQTYFVESKEKIDEAQFKKFLETISKNGNVKDKFAKLKEKREEVNHKLTQFSKGIKDLSENIELGHRIKGKCSVGY